MGCVPLSVTGGIKYLWVPATGLNSDTVTNSWPGLADTTLLKATPGSLNAIVKPVQSAIYSRNVESTRVNGSYSDDMFVQVYDKLLIPNAFSPNGNGINDTCVIEPLDFFYKSVTSIFNRYGQLVFTSKSYSKPWDGRLNGRPVPVGIYYYVIELKANKEPPLTGSLLVIR